MAATRKDAFTPNMVETMKEFKETKSIDRTTLVSVLEESFRNVIAKIESWITSLTLLRNAYRHHSRV